MHSDEDGSAAVESVFSMFFLMFLVVGTIQVALTLYGRNVVAAAAHEGARSAIELGANPASAAVVAERTIRQSAAGIAQGITVQTTVDRSDELVAVQVQVRGRLRSFGPIPVTVPITAVASTSRELVP